MNFIRILTGVIGFPIVAVVLIFGDKYVIDVAFAIIAGMSLHEYYKAFREKAKPVAWLGYLACALIAFIHIIPKSNLIYIIGFLIPAFIIILFLQEIFSNMKYDMKDIAITLFGICYIPLFLMFIPILNGMENGKFLVWYTVIPAWGTDVFAYFIGKYLGKHKFSKISPNKTIEGCLGGILGAVFFMIIYSVVVQQFGFAISYWKMIPITIVLSIFSQIGDFAASSIKRYVGIKDFSNLLPGHGGMLDRIDSIIFIAPIAFFLLLLV